MMASQKIVFLFFIFCFSFFAKAQNYKCLPCGQNCDKEVFTQAGKCAHCNMDLVLASSITFKNIETTKACDYIKAHPKTILLDVRSKEEFEGKADPDFGSLKNAINIPVEDLKKRWKELEKYKNVEIIVYCSHSHRSPRASYLLTQNGFKNIINLSGGISALNDNACKK